MSIFERNNMYMSYEKNSHNQKSASTILIDLLSIQSYYKIIDIGCGSGENTYKLSILTDNAVLGVDESNGMINICKNKYSDKSNLEFETIKAKNIDNYNHYDVAFCSSVMHWFKNPHIELIQIRKCLKTNGVLALQSPTKDWSPFLINSINKTLMSKELMPYSIYYKCPWFHLSTEEEYSELLTNCGFTKILIAFKQEIISRDCSADKIIDMFESGPAGAYLNPDNYSMELPTNFTSIFRCAYRKTIEEMICGNNIDISYNRVFIVAQNN